jgi:hypothetical protein
MLEVELPRLNAGFTLMNVLGLFGFGSKIADFQHSVIAQSMLDVDFFNILSCGIEDGV